MLTTTLWAGSTCCVMSNPNQIHKGKTPIRIHYIPEWAERRHLTQADLVRELGVDKGLVSRWFSGTVPTEKWLEPLAGVLSTDVHGLFRHPDEDWIANFLRGKTEEERERLRNIIQNAFPKTGTES